MTTVADTGPGQLQVLLRVAPWATGAREMITISELAVEHATAVAASVREAAGMEGKGWVRSIATRGAVLPSTTLRSTSTAIAMAASSRSSRSRAPGYGLSTPSPPQPGDRPGWRFIACWDDRDEPFEIGVENFGVKGREVIKHAMPLIDRITPGSLVDKLDAAKPGWDERNPDWRDPAWRPRRGGSSEQT
jgi:hypothetical protein